MKISKLQVQHFRNLETVSIYPSSCNIILGKNGSGKTSLLESIYLLSRGKSFRHYQPKNYIRYGCEKTVVFAELNADSSQTIGIEKNQNANTQLKYQGQIVQTQSEITKCLPTVLFEPSNLNNLELGSQPRREILDWLMFHVEHQFYPHWVTYQRLLKQRNILLKKINHLSYFFQQEMMAWDSQLAHHAKVIHNLRTQVLQKWQDYFASQVQIFLPQYANNLRLKYLAGFDVEQDLAHILAERLLADIEMGYTRMGCHRMDINVMLDLEQFDEKGQRSKRSLPAVDVLSRGERKLLMLALRLSQLPLLNAVGKVPLVLLDDITAELDNHALQILLKGLKQFNSQLFISSLSDEILSLVQTIWQNDVKMFHVEQGEVCEFLSDSFENIAEK